MATGEWDDYVYPGTNVLRNKADIRETVELQRFERGVTAVRIQQMREQPIQGDFDLAHLRNIHKQVFQDVYAWAGELRTVDIAKGAGANRTVFAYTEDIPNYGARAHEIVKEAHYGRGLHKEQFAKTMTDVYTVVNEMHPFREGNGRATREYMTALASQSGHSLDYEKVGRDVWNEAAKESAHGNPGPMREVFYEITTVERAAAFDKLHPSQALALHPELDGAYKRMMHAGDAGLDTDKTRSEISRDLHSGRVVESDVTLEESKLVIDRAAAYRGLIVREAADTGGSHRGEVVAVSSHHSLLKVGDMVAVRYERHNLDRAVHQNDRVTIQYGSEKSQVYARGQEPPRERGGHDIQMEREIAPH